MTAKTEPDIRRLIELERMMLRFRDIERKVHLPDHLDSFENDVEHSYTLAMASWYISGFYDEIDRDKVIRYALVHDLVEVHAGDTFPYGDPKYVASKHEREAAAQKQLRQEWPDFTDMNDAIDAYESKQDREATFVYAVDKILPTILNLLGKGHGWRVHNIALDDVLHEKESKTRISPEVYAIYEQLAVILQKNRHMFPKQPS